MFISLTRPFAATAAASRHLAAAALVAATWFAPAHSAELSYDFSVTIDSVGSSLFGQSFNGTLTYDDALPTGLGAAGQDLFAVTAFEFDFAGQFYVRNDLFYADAAVLSPNFVGIEAAHALFAFTPGDGTFAPFFSFDLGLGDAGNGELVFTPQAGLLPEPDTGLLALGALLAVAGLRRRA